MTANQHTWKSASALLKGIGIFGFMFIDFGFLSIIMMALAGDFFVHLDAADDQDQQILNEVNQRALAPPVEGGRFARLPVVYTDGERTEL